MSILSRRSFFVGVSASVAAPVLTPGAQASTGIPFTITPRSRIDRQFAGQKPTYWGFYAPGVLSRFSTSTRAGKDAVCLTFDACGGSVTQYDADLIAVLRRHQVPATLFLNRTWMTNNPGITRELVADPLFEIENHGWAHLPLSVTGRSAYGIKGTTSVDAVWCEVAAPNWYLGAQFNVASRFMRTGTAYTDDVAARAVTAMGQRLVSFSINGDAGASYPAPIVFSETMKARPGDIIISHMNRPGSGTAPGYAKVIPAMKAKGYTFRHLRDIA